MQQSRKNGGLLKPVLADFRSRTSIHTGPFSVGFKRRSGVAVRGLSLQHRAFLFNVSREQRLVIHRPTDTCGNIKAFMSHCKF